MSETKRMTDKEYVDNRGNKCPYCSSENFIVTEGIQSYGSSAWADVLCKDCNKEWVDIYTLTGYEEPEYDD